MINVKAEICPKCGVRQSSPRRSGRDLDYGIRRGLDATDRTADEVSVLVGRRSRITAALLAFFLGGLGVHRFYLGKIATGVIYLVFCLTLIPGLIALIEGIILLCMSDEEFHRKYPTT